MKKMQDDIVILLDIDCIPLTQRALRYLGGLARRGTLAGAVQRSNHIDNGGHLYVGPFCMALSIAAYRRMGRPSFNETDRGDVGEELTYRWDELGGNTRFLWPSRVECPQWALVKDRSFGFGTTYEDLFYHAFCIREGLTTGLFLSKCRAVLAETNPL
jgi:hypothetical protein